MRTMVAALAGSMELSPSLAKHYRFRIKAITAKLPVIPPVELVAQGRGPGWHRLRWRNRWAIGTGDVASRIGNFAPSGRCTGEGSCQAGDLALYREVRCGGPLDLDPAWGYWRGVDDVISCGVRTPDHMLNED
jgi:hypothetical protein